MRLDPTRATPAVAPATTACDYVPTNKHVLFGHHFAAIAGAGPLVGPVLAAQMGYLPGTLWILVGVVLAGAVQDFMVLFVSTRRDGRSLGEMVREEMGPVPGTIALFGAFVIMIIILAVLALIVVKALADSPWGMFTVIGDDPDRAVHGRLHALHPARHASARSRSSASCCCCWRSGSAARSAAHPALGPGLHLHRHAARLDADRLRLRRRGAAGVAAAGAARLPVDLPQDRHDRRAGDRHPDRDAGR